MAEVKGGDKLEAALRQMADKLGKASRVKVGFLEGATYPEGGLTVATIAALQNFGAPEAGIPARPYFTNMVAEQKSGWGEKFATVLKAVDYDADKSLELMGVGIAGQLREAIVNLNEPALSPVTLLLRQRFSDHVDIEFSDVQQARHDVASGEVPDVTATQAKPLVWTGHMLASVDSEVE